VDKSFAKLKKVTLHATSVDPIAVIIIKFIWLAVKPIARGMVSFMVCNKSLSNKLN